MSGEQQFIKTSITAYLKLCFGQESSDSIVDDDLLASETAKIKMIGILERIVDVFTREAVKLKNRRNNEHLAIHRLPPEVFVEILLLAIDCRFWTPIDVMGNAKARRMAMKRNRTGPVDVWCWSRPEPEAMNAFMEDVQTVHSSRWRSILYDHRPETQVFLEHLRTQTSGLIDVLLFNPEVYGPAVSLELSQEGPHLRHIDHIYHVIPHPEDLCQILSTSPRLERLCLIEVNSQEAHRNSQESLQTISHPISLPLLTVLAFDNASKSITSGLLPLIRATSCKTVIVKGEGEFSAILEPQERSLELIAQPIKASESLRLKLETEGEPHVHIHSEPAIAVEWAYWAFDKPGVDIKLASCGGPSTITNIEIEWSMDSSGQEVPFPVGLLEFCPALTRLQVTDYSTTTLTPLVRLLRKTTSPNADRRNSAYSWLLPNVNTFIFHAESIRDLEECATEVKGLLETRYAEQKDGRTDQSIVSPTPMEALKLPSVLVARLRAMKISTCLKFDDVIQGTATENA
ncbi:hypothetical protein FRC05_011516 [Tulasnella sp. 425]|nr:hypothetical protein FRC05_011516 [Tulasnella sp. 425]